MLKSFPSNTFLAIFMLLSLGSLVSVNAADSDNAEQTNTEQTFEFIGSIVYLPIEGGFYGIEADALDNEKPKKYLPKHLNEVFQQEGLRVKVQARLATGQMGFKMWGNLIDIINIISTDCQADHKTSSNKTEANE